MRRDCEYAEEVPRLLEEESTGATGRQGGRGASGQLELLDDVSPL